MRWDFPAPACGKISGTLSADLERRDGESAGSGPRTGASGRGHTDDLRFTNPLKPFRDRTPNFQFNRIFTGFFANSRVVIGGSRNALKRNPTVGICRNTPKRSCGPAFAGLPWKTRPNSNGPIPDPGVPRGANPGAAVSSPGARHGDFPNQEPPGDDCPVGSGNRVPADQCHARQGIPFSAQDATSVPPERTLSAPEVVRARYHSGKRHPGGKTFIATTCGIGGGSMCPALVTFRNPPARSPNTSDRLLPDQVPAATAVVTVPAEFGGLIHFA